MYKQQIEENLKSLRIPYSIKGDEVSCRCLNPEHKDNNPSFSINITTGAYNCFSCGFKGSIVYLWDGIEVDEVTIRESKYTSLLESWHEDEEIPYKEFSEALMPPVDHLVDYDVRGVPKEILQDLGVYYCSKGKYKGRLIFPIRDLEGTLLSFDARIYSNPKGKHIEPMFPDAKYLRPPAVPTKDIVYPLDYISTHFQEDYVILTEGIFDAISLIALGFPAVCNFGLGAPSTTKMGRVMSLGVTSIVNGFDGDTKGQNGWQNIKETWRQFLKIKEPIEIIKTIWKNGKDANEYLKELKGLK